MGNMIYVTGEVRSLLRPAVWSNLFFLAPLFFALERGAPIVAIAVGVLLASSLAYHTFSEAPSGILLWNDRFFASLLTLINAGLIAFGGFSFPYFQAVALLAIVALYIFKKQWKAFTSDVSAYEWHHATWHFLTAIITVFSILAFYT